MKTHDRLNLALRALLRYVSVFAAMSILLFLPAGTLSFCEGFYVISILLIPVLIIGIVLFIRNPALLNERLEIRESRRAQKIITKAAAAIVGIGFVMAGIDYKWSLSEIPTFLKILGAIATILSYSIYGFVFYENKYLHKTICVQDNQQVINTGIYGYIRHPMYLASALLYFSMAIASNSLITVLLFCLLLPLVYLRIKDEERYLLSALPAYSEYVKTVKYKLIPFVW